MSNITIDPTNTMYFLPSYIKDSLYEKCLRDNCNEHSFIFAYVNDSNYCLFQNGLVVYDANNQWTNYCNEQAMYVMFTYAVMLTFIEIIVGTIYRRLCNVQ